MSKTIYSNESFKVKGKISELCLETHGSFNIENYLQVLEGKCALYIARNVIDSDSCERIAKAFDNTTNKDCYNISPIIESIGKPLYFAKDRHNYFKGASQHQENINKLFRMASVTNYSEDLFFEIQNKLGKDGYNVRLMQSQGLNAFYGIMRRWGFLETDEEGRAARLHEDRVQMRFHDGLETQKCIHNPLVSTCIYYENGESGGELILYNYRPSLTDAENEELNSSNQYGFPDKLKEGLDFLKVRPEKGDIICFWADFLHEVNAIKGRWRINSTFFSARIDNNEIIFWS